MKIRIGIHPAFVLIILIGFFTETLFRMMGVYLCLLIHEAGHAVAAYGFKQKISYIKIMPFGIAMRLTGGRKSEKTDFIISLAGPVFSIIAGLLFKNEFLRVTNITLGIFNLLPVKTLDGGKLYFILLSRILGCIRGYSILKKTSLFISVLLFMSGGYAAYITKFNISLVLVSVFLIYSIVAGNDYSRVSAHFTALDYRKKKSRQGIFKVKHLAISQDMPLRRILMHIPSGRLGIIDILDSDSRIVSSISEQTAVDIMLTHGANASYASAQKGEIT